MKQITDIFQVKEVYTECMASIQDKISGSDFLIVFDEKNRKEMIFYELNCSSRSKLGNRQ